MEREFNLNTNKNDWLAKKMGNKINKYVEY